MRTRAIPAIVFSLSLVAGLVACDSPDSADGAGCVTGAIQSCSTICNSLGTSTCQGGAFGPCIPPTQEIANGLDDNCNGQVDEGLSGTGTGTVGTEACTTPGQQEGCITNCSSIGTRTCSSQKKWGQCMPPQETCNGKDDDCNGQVDDKLNRTCQTACGNGTETCSAGVWGNCTAAAPQEETCDGLDNDCDGKTDLAANGTALVQTCNEGCGFGSQTCSNAQWSPCSKQPEAEKCDGLDNDCNGKIDDAPGGCNCSAGQTKACGSDIGECNPGSQQCVNGQWTECGGAGYKAAVDEVCDGLDNNCNGVVDEGNPQGGTACGTQNSAQGGAPNITWPCTIGQMQCLNGQLQCVGGVDPQPEICDLIDNDCNGLVDDNPQGDQYEPNNSCQQLTDVGFVVEDQGTTTLQGNLFPGSDVDWIRITAKEKQNFCLGGEEGPYQLTIKMTPPPNLDYDLCVYPADSASCSSLPAEGLCDGTGGSTNLGIFKSAGVAETYTSDTWMGGCFSNDDRDFIVQVVTFDSQNDFSCDPYKLEFTFSSN